MLNMDNGKTGLSIIHTQIDFVVRHFEINNRKPYPRRRTAPRPKGDRGTKCRVADLASPQSLGLRYRMCNETVTRSK